MKKRIASLLLVVAMLFSMTANAFAVSVPPATASGEAAVAAFQDVSADFWAYSGIRDVVSRGLYQGTSPTTFEPNKNMSRAQFVIVLARYDGRSDLENQPATTGFTDVPSDFWAAGAVAWAASNNIVLGYGGENGTNVFYPNRTISRAQIAALVYRYLSYKTDVLADGSTRTWAEMLPAVNNPVSQFSDLGTVPDVFREAVEFCRTRNLMRGYEDGSLRPNVNVTRAQVATILSRMIEVLGQVSGDVTPTPVAANGINLAASSSQNGTTTVREENGRVYITATPDAGYAVESVTVTDANGNRLAVTRLANGEYVFDKPAALPVTISVIYDIDNSAYYTFTAGSNADGNSSRITNVERLSGRTWDEIAYRNADGKLIFREGYSGIQVGDRLTVTHIANTGYAFDSILIRDNNGKRVTADRRDSERTRFTLPTAIPVEIDVAFYKSGERHSSGGSGGGGGGGGGGAYSYNLQWAPSDEYAVTVYANSPLNTVDGLLNTNVQPLAVYTVPQGSTVMTEGNSYSIVSYQAYVRIVGNGENDCQPTFKNANGEKIKANRVADGLYGLTNITSNITLEIETYDAYKITKAADSLDFTIARAVPNNQDYDFITNADNANFTMAQLPWTAAAGDIMEVNLASGLISTLPAGSTVVVRVNGEPYAPVIPMTSKPYLTMFPMPAEDVEVSVTFEDAAWVTMNVTGAGVVKLGDLRFSNRNDTQLVPNLNMEQDYTLELVAFPDWAVPTTIKSSASETPVAVTNNTATVRLYDMAEVDVAFTYQPAAHDYYLAVESAPDNALESGAMAFNAANKPFEMTSNLYADNGAVYLKLQGSPVAITATDKAIMNLSDAIKAQIENVRVDYNNAVYRSIDVSPEETAPYVDDYVYDATAENPAFSITMAYYAVPATVDGNADARVIPVQVIETGAVDSGSVAVNPRFYDASSVVSSEKVDFSFALATTTGNSEEKTAYIYQYSAETDKGVWIDEEANEMASAPVLDVGALVSIAPVESEIYQIQALRIGSRTEDCDQENGVFMFTVTSDDIAADGTITIQVAVQIMNQDTTSGEVQMNAVFVDVNGDPVDQKFDFRFPITFGENSYEFRYDAEDEEVSWRLDGKSAAAPVVSVGTVLSATYQSANGYVIKTLTIGEQEETLPTLDLQDGEAEYTIEEKDILNGIVTITLYVTVTERADEVMVAQRFVNENGDDLDDANISFRFPIDFVYADNTIKAQYRYDADTQNAYWIDTEDEENPNLEYIPALADMRIVAASYATNDYRIDSVIYGPDDTVIPLDETDTTINVAADDIQDGVVWITLVVTVISETPPSNNVVDMLTPAFVSADDPETFLEEKDRISVLFAMTIDYTDAEGYTGDDPLWNLVYFYDANDNEGSNWSRIVGEDMESVNGAPPAFPGMKIVVSYEDNDFGSYHIDEVIVGHVTEDTETYADMQFPKDNPDANVTVTEKFFNEENNLEMMFVVTRCDTLDVLTSFYAYDDQRPVENVDVSFALAVDVTTDGETEHYIYTHTPVLPLWTDENGELTTTPVITAGSTVKVELVGIDDNAYINAISLGETTVYSFEEDPETFNEATVTASDISDFKAIMNVDVYVMDTVTVQPKFLDKDGNEPTDDNNNEVPFNFDLILNAGVEDAEKTYHYVYFYDTESALWRSEWLDENGNDVRPPVFPGKTTVTVNYEDTSSYKINSISIDGHDAPLTAGEAYTVQAEDINDNLELVLVPEVQPVVIYLNVESIITDKNGDAENIPFEFEVSLSGVQYLYKDSAWFVKQGEDDEYTDMNGEAPIVIVGDKISATATPSNVYTMGIFYPSDWSEELAGKIDVSVLKDMPEKVIQTEDIKDGVLTLYVRIVWDDSIQYALRVVRNELAQAFIADGGSIEFTTTLPESEDEPSYVLSADNSAFTVTEDYWELADAGQALMTIGYTVNTNDDNGYEFKSMSVWNGKSGAYADIEDEDGDNSVTWYAAEYYTTEDDVRVIEFLPVFASKESKIEVLPPMFHYSDDAELTVRDEDQQRFTFELFFENDPDRNAFYTYYGAEAGGIWELGDGETSAYCPVQPGDRIRVEVTDGSYYKEIKVTDISGNDMTAVHTVTAEELEAYGNFYYLNVNATLDMNAPTFTVTVKDQGTAADGTAADLGKSVIYEWALSDVSYDEASDDQKADWNNWTESDGSFTEPTWVRIVANPASEAKVDKFAVSTGAAVTMTADENIPDGNEESRFIDLPVDQDITVTVYYSPADSLPFTLTVNSDASGYFDLAIRQEGANNIHPAPVPSGQENQTTYSYTFNGNQFDETGDSTLMFYATKPSGGRPVIEVKLTESDTEIYDLENGSSLTLNGDTPFTSATTLSSRGQNPNYIYNVSDGETGEREITYRIAWPDGSAELMLDMKEIEYEYALKLAPVIGNGTLNGAKTDNEPIVFLQSSGLTSNADSPMTLRDALQTLAQDPEEYLDDTSKADELDSGSNAMANLTDQLGETIKAFDTVPVVNETVINSAIQDKLAAKVNETLDSMMDNFKDATEDAVSQVGESAKQKIQEMLVTSGADIPDGFTLKLAGGTFNVSYDESALQDIKDLIADNIVLKTLDSAYVEALTDGEEKALRDYANGKALPEEYQYLLDEIEENLSDKLDIEFRMNNRLEDDKVVISVEVVPVLARVTASLQETPTLTFNVRNSSLNYYIVSEDDNPFAALGLQGNHIVDMDKAPTEADIRSGRLPDGFDLGEYSSDTTAAPRTQRLQDTRQELEIKMGEVTRLIMVENVDDEGKQIPIDLANLLATNPNAEESGDMIGKLNKLFNSRIDGDNYLSSRTSSAYANLYNPKNPNNGTSFVNIYFDQLPESEKDYAHDIKLAGSDFVTVTENGEIEINLKPDDWTNIYTGAVDGVLDLRDALYDYWYNDANNYGGWMGGIWDSNIAKDGSDGKFVNTNRDNFVKAFKDADENLSLNKLFRALYDGDGDDASEINMPSGYTQGVLLQFSRAFSDEGQIGEALDSMFNGNNAYLRLIICRQRVAQD